MKKIKSSTLGMLVLSPVLVGGLSTIIVSCGNSKQDISNIRFNTNIADYNGLYSDGELSEKFKLANNQISN
jgi:hypothetical protein